MAQYLDNDNIVSMMESFEPPPDDCKRRNQETEFVDLRAEKRVSEEVERDYEALQQKYELEKQRCSEAEQFATEIQIQNKAMKNQIMVLMQQNGRYEQEIKELKKAAESEDKMFKELDNSAYLDEIRDLKAKIKQFEDQYNQLEIRYISLEARFEEATRPPPPPPPPPPPSLTTKSNGFLSKSEKKNPAGAQNVPQTYTTVINEMMELINSGKLLTPHAKAPLQQWPSETADTPSEPGLVATLKKRSASVDASVPEKKEEELEFLTAYFKLQGGRLKQLLNPMDEENN